MSAVELPPLPTPETFDFPYPKPYDIQLQLMQTVFRAIEDRKIAIVESPTGTGKSLTLLTSTLTWLAAHQRRLDEQAELSLRAKLSADDPDDPPWVIEHAVKSQFADLRAAQEARQARLAAVRAKERKAKLANGSKAFRHPETKKAKRGSTKGPAGSGGLDDDEFLPEDKEDKKDQTDGVHLSKEVQELMAKYEASRPKAHVEEEREEDVPKIYYTSRTHTQLRQLTSELLKTSFANSLLAGDASEERPGISMVPLGSRKQLCINEKVRALAKGGGDERMNEACLDMQKSGKARCDFLPSKADESSMAEARDAVLATVRDIEDIVTMGKNTCVCPYYATRKAVKQAQLVTLPYNLLLQKNAREALEIDLKDQIVVIDEAHNLIDTLLSIHSTSISSNQLPSAVSQLQQYLHRFRNRLKPVHALWIRQTLNVLQGLSRLCGEAAFNNGKAEMLDANTLMAKVGGGSDQVNLMELVSYLKESKLARKVSGFAEKTAEVTAKKESNGARSTAAKHASVAAFHLVESFLLSLTDARDDGRVLLSSERTGIGSIVTMKYILLNPAERFREVVEQARSVVLAGGTMEPISDFLRQLFPTIPPDRFSTLSCAHVIPKINLLTQVICQGPRKLEFEFKYANREDESLAGALSFIENALLISTKAGRARRGDSVNDRPCARRSGCLSPLICFSGQSQDKLDSIWSLAAIGRAETGTHCTSGQHGRLMRPKMFYEPKTSGDVDSVLRDYALAISSSEAAASGEKSRRTGALLFAVVGGKLSEGINFSDRLGRCVIMVGLPFANVGSVELQERMRYVEKLPGAGKDAAKELYENLCMRAVNQSIGRAIRHVNDFATILLVDKRYATPRIRNKLPGWIGEDVKVQEEYSGAARAIAAFFREKRERGQA